MKAESKIKTLGFINADKPSGLTSSAVVNKIKRLTGLPSGHMGTLDPLASGVLPVGIGDCEVRPMPIADFAALFA